ncbi:MAG: DUF2585 family protein [Pyrinomonadaceae bacterium]
MIELNEENNVAEKLARHFVSNYLPYLLLLTVIIGAIFVLYCQGRIWWCKWDTPIYLWSSDAWGTHNSQHLFDPYSLTHVLHGLGFYGILYSVFRRKIPLAWLLFITVFAESAWEVLENSKSVIERYRAATISLEYFGDSITNSFGDIFCCIVGFLIAHKLGFRRSLALFALIEIVLIFWIHDSLLINILMLIHPIEAIKTWQMGG